MDSLKLNELEAGSELWLKLRKHFEARLALLREQNDHSKPADQTERIRGRIAEVKLFLALDKPEADSQE